MEFPVSMKQLFSAPDSWAVKIVLYGLLALLAFWIAMLGLTFVATRAYGAEPAFQTMTPITNSSHTVSVFDVCAGYHLKKNGDLVLELWCPNNTTTPFATFLGCQNPTAFQRIAAGRIVVDITCEQPTYNFSCTGSVMAPSARKQ